MVRAPALSASTRASYAGDPGSRAKPGERSAAASHDHLLAGASALQMLSEALTECLRADEFNGWIGGLSVELVGLEPTTFRLPAERSSS